ncbi:LacI family transcriptional regulator [Actinorhabdospora filicis]|uniref:LacI family transcriptional regulator n=1 Tax=Actinorhabdospora filicis TaxID=1785913 RepID=A0A9W6WDK3_9ACTN|nr:LacI family DNA-binding transcriptional regulator [Actinorhabdospora filicis]GLZ81696.1 LacI family transcriptional regulator [Actinorhabdospora filicis]
MQPRRATIADVAARANVSSATVSRALAGNYPVAKDTRERIEAAVSALGYVVNAQARALAGQATRTVGIIIQEIVDPFYAFVARGVEQEAAVTGRLCLVCCTHGDPRQELAFIDLLHEQRADAVILVGGAISDKRHAGEIMARGASLRQHGGLLIHCGRATPSADIAAVEYDNEGGAFAATDHLITNGHTRILYLGGPRRMSTSADRLAGYKRALSSRNLPFDPDLVRLGAFGQPFGHTGMLEALDAGLDFTAVFAANDSTAIGAYAALSSRGLRVPEDISMVGYDDIPAARLLKPELTTVHVPLEEMGRQAVRLAAAHADGYGGGDIRLGTHLVLRDSVSAPRRKKR